MVVSRLSSSQNRSLEAQRDGKEPTDSKRRPILRGWLHAIAVPYVIHVGIDIIHKAPTNPIKHACLAYVVFVALQFTVSAIYNVPTWDPETRLALRKLDHAWIYFVIAATYTPFCIIASEIYPLSLLLLLFMWTIAIIGFASSLLKKGGFKSKAISSASYILIGWCGTPALITGVFSKSVYNYLLLGGLSYSIGGIMYALHWPNPVRRVLEYHEMFHLCTIVANSMMCEAILQAL